MGATREPGYNRSVSCVSMHYSVTGKDAAGYINCDVRLIKPIVFIVFIGGNQTASHLLRKNQTDYREPFASRATTLYPEPPTCILIDSATLYSFDFFLATGINRCGGVRLYFCFNSKCTGR